MHCVYLDAWNAFKVRQWKDDSHAKYTSTLYWHNEADDWKLSANVTKCFSFSSHNKHNNSIDDNNANRWSWAKVTERHFFSAYDMAQGYQSIYCVAQLLSFHGPADVIHRLIRTGCGKYTILALGYFALDSHAKPNSNLFSNQLHDVQYMPLLFAHEMLIFLNLFYLCFVVVYFALNGFCQN